MYEPYWNLKLKPFENVADPRFLYYSKEHEEALMRLIYVVKEGKSGGIFIGDCGIGKTTLAHALLEELTDPEKYQFVYIANPIIEPLEFIKEIIYQLGVEFDFNLGRLQLKHLLEETLRRNMEKGKRIIVIIDEAHLINDQETWEELRLLLNLQLNNKMLLTILLIGQPPLAKTIGKLQHFRQRLAMRYYLKPLSEKEVNQYISHRLNVAGTSKSVFSKDSTQLIFSQSKGTPREINNICDMSLLVSFTKKAKVVEKEIVQEVIKDLEEVF